MRAPWNAKEGATNANTTYAGNVHGKDESGAVKACMSVKRHEIIFYIPTGMCSFLKRLSCGVVHWT